ADWMRDHWRDLDINRDAAVTPDELDAARLAALSDGAGEEPADWEEVGPLAGFTQEHAASIDANGDGRASAAELEQMLSDLVARLDGDRNGAITTSDVRTPAWQILLGIIILTVVGIVYTL